MLKVSEKSVKNLMYKSDFWSSISLQELLTIALGKDSNAIVEKLSQNFSDIMSGLKNLTKEDLIMMKISDANANRIMATIELSKRIAYTKIEKGDIIDTPGKAALAMNQIAYESREHLMLICLDVRSQMICSPIVLSIGSAVETLASPREVFRIALLKGAIKVIIGHNHPSGNSDPSPQDLGLTKTLLHSGQILDISVIDHVIIALDNYSSLRELHPELWEETPQALAG